MPANADKRRGWLTDLSACIVQSGGKVLWRAADEASEAGASVGSSESGGTGGGGGGSASVGGAGGGAGSGGGAVGSGGDDGRGSSLAALALRTSPLVTSSVGGSDAGGAAVCVSPKVESRSRAESQDREATASPAMSQNGSIANSESNSTGAGGGASAGPASGVSDARDRSHWEANELHGACMICESRFTLTRRRHHCRNWYVGLMQCAWWWCWCCCCCYDTLGRAPDL